MLKVADINKLIAPVSDNNEIKYYVHNEELKMYIILIYRLDMMEETGWNTR